MDIASVNTIEECFDLHKAEIAKMAGFDYLNCSPYQWKDADGSVHEMTDMSLRRLKDARKLIVADREKFTSDSDKQVNISRAIIGENGDADSIAKKLIRLMTDKENELREEIHKRP